jgi:hypothetical protein
MAKPDIQASFITASGTLYRDKGKLGLEDKGPILGKDLSALRYANDAAAIAAGVQPGELYINTSNLNAVTLLV